MAASSSKPTAVHYTMIFFVVTTIVAGVIAYNFGSESSKAKVAEAAANASAQQANTAARKALDDLQELKRVLGKTQFEVVFDSGNPQNPATVVGSLRQDMRDFGKTLAATTDTYAGVLANMREALDTLTSERDSQTASVGRAQQEILALESRYRQNSEEFRQAKVTAEGGLQSKINEVNEQILAKDQQIGELRKLYNESQVLLEQEQEGREKDRQLAQSEIDKLVLINDKLRAEVDELKQESFEVPDGRIRRVDNTSRMVWIDLGDADFLKPRMTFSVYGKDTPGVARTTADIKGKIEVTRIINANLAEAKIIEEDLFRPMAPGDFIYTPLWRPGRPERFAIVGKIDLDGNGKSDRVLFHQEMAVRGAAIVDEVDDLGVREGTGIDESIKFLIMGNVPDINDVALGEERNAIEKIAEHQADMRKEARLYGVRIIPLNDFLDYIGYKPKRRVFKPGETPVFNLQTGMPTPSTKSLIETSVSTGQVSGRYGAKSRALPAQTSGGATSKVFGGN